MKKIIKFLQLLLITIPLIIIPNINGHTGNSGNTPLKKSGKIAYIDIGIYQPNVEDCLGMTVPEMGIDSNWISIFPNPNPGKFTLKLQLQAADTKLLIQIYNLAGKLVYETAEVPDGQQFNKDLDLSHLKKGAYFIRVTGKDRVGVKQIIMN